MLYKSPYKNINGRKFNDWCVYKKRIDTYGLGCEHNCNYCYAKTLLEFRRKWKTNPLNSDLIEIYYRVKKLIPGDIVRLGSLTDCFQPIELKNRITFKTIKILNKRKIHYLIITKSSIVSNPEYLQIYDKSLAHFQISITGTNDKIVLKNEKASLISERIKSIETLYNLGFDVSIRLSPLIENRIDFDIINSINCDKILIEFLKVNHFVKKWFNIDYSEYTLKYGGYEHLELFKKIELVNKITGFNQISVGEYVREHHEYFSKNVNFNKLDCCNLNYQKRKINKQLTWI
jgi:DNA repair photolyase